MARISEGRRFPFWILLGHLPVGLSLTLPTATSSSHHTLRSPAFDSREEPVTTMYGFSDPYSESEDSDTPLPHVKDVFQALAQHSLSATHTTASLELLESDNASATMTASFTVTTPPMHGPGLVLLTSPIFPDVGSPTTMPMDPTPTLLTNELPEHAGLAKHTAVVLGSVVGGIVLFILCLFFLIAPSITRKIFCCSWRSRKPPSGIMNTPEDQEKGSNSQISLDAKSVPGTPNPADRTLVNSPNTTQDAKLEKVKDLDELTSQLPASKFSICSSDYVTSSRNSEVSLVSSPYAIMPSVTFAPSPTRPPRPPTADSPALSESVYLACADKNYMIVTPEPLSGEDNSIPRKRHLTPSEFLALHVPGILAGFSLSSSTTDVDKPANSSKKQDRASAIVELTSSRRSSSRSSRHSRTKSAPMLSPTSRKRNVNHPTAGDDEETKPLNVPGTIGQSLAKHRRSRSASGWAYPDRPRTRRTVNS